MSYLEYNTKYVPTGFRKLLYLNWPIIILLTAVSCAGFVMLYSVAGGSVDPWMAPQVKRFGAGMVLMIGVAMVPIWFWRNVSVVAFGGSLLLLVAVELFGEVGMGAQRWIDLGFMRLQPSELTKITLVMVLAAYYDWLPTNKTSHPTWVIIPVIIILVPTALVLGQPDLGTAILLLFGGATIMFAAGVHWAYFGTVFAAGIGTIVAVLIRFWTLPMIRLVRAITSRRRRSPLALAAGRGAVLCKAPSRALTFCPKNIPTLFLPPWPKSSALLAHLPC